MAQAKGAPVQDPFLNILRKEHIPVSIFLVNGIKLQGQIDSYDQFVILLKNAVNQMIYKHAISTIVPAKSISIPIEGQDNNAGDEEDQDQDQDQDQDEDEGDEHNY